MVMQLMRVVLMNDPRRTNVKITDATELVCHYELHIQDAGMQWNLS